VLRGLITLASMSFVHRLAFLAACSALVQGCFYDHRITQAIQARQRRAREAEGARIGSSGGTAPVRVGRVGRVRFYVAGDYRRQHPDWQRQLEELVERASAVLAPSFGLRLEVSELHTWEPSCDAAALRSCLDELAKTKPADEQEWLVGVLAAEPRFTASFDELGMAHHPGQHFVLRDVSDLAERAAIDRAFPAHTQGQRDDIYKHRKQHKRLAVFLHEWGHALGAMHTVASEGLLHPSYDDRMTDFDAANAGIVHAALDDAFGAEPGHDSLLAELHKASPEGFTAGERDALIARVQADVKSDEAARPEEAEEAGEAEEPEEPSEGEQAKQMFVVAGDEAKLLAGFTDGERAAYREAVRLLQAEEPEKSLSVLAPVVKSHPDSYAVQHLACGLNMVLGAQTDMQVTCARAQELALKN
jgi:hypothetical protein